MKLSLFVICVALVLSGCKSTEGHVIATTATIIGVDLGQGQGTQAVTGTLGYKRAEFAYVPTDKGLSNGSAANSADVLMELQYQNIFSGNGAIHQRLAVGRNAVSQKEATQLLFSKDEDGKVSAAVAESLGKEDASIKKITACFTSPNGALDTTKRDAAIAVAKGTSPRIYSDSMEKALKVPTTPAALSSFLYEDGDVAVPTLFAALPSECV